MPLPFITGSRRGRLLSIIILLTFFVLWLGSPTPLSTIRQDPYNLHPVNPPPTSPNINGQSHYEATPNNDPPSHEADEADDTVGAVDDPSSSTTEHVFADDADDNSKAEPADATTTTTTSAAAPTSTLECLDYETRQRQKAEPLSEGKRKFPYLRPPPDCRKFPLPALGDLLDEVKKAVRDPDLFRLFENTYPATLDTWVKWRGYATKKDETTGEETKTDEELAYVVSGDVEAMGLRDSANQMYSYLPLLQASEDKDSLASLWRGVINSQARYIAVSPYCNAFQPPAESGLKPTHNPAYNQTAPPFDSKVVFECKWELDNLASFLQLSTAYHSRTNDTSFFGKHSWVDAVEAAVSAATAMRRGTHDDKGNVIPSAWNSTVHANETHANPTKENGMIRSAFRPNGEPCVFQLLTPSNMMFATYLDRASEIMQGLADGGATRKAANLTTAMRDLAEGIRRGIALDAVVTHREFGEIFAYEVDGFGGASLLDEVQPPSLLAMPLWNFTLPTGSGKTMVKSAKHPPRAKRETEDNKNDTLDLSPPLPKTSTASRRRPQTKPTPSPSPSPKTANTTLIKTPLNKTTTLLPPSSSKPLNLTALYLSTRLFSLSPSNPSSSSSTTTKSPSPLTALLAALTSLVDPSLHPSPEARDKELAGQFLVLLDSAAAAAAAAEGGEGVVLDGGWGMVRGWAGAVFGEVVLRGVHEVVDGGKGVVGGLWQD